MRLVGEMSQHTKCIYPAMTEYHCMSCSGIVDGLLGLQSFKTPRAKKMDFII